MTRKPITRSEATGLAVVGLAILAAGLPVVSPAQDTLASLAGVVQESSGAVVPDSRLTLEASSGGAARETRSDQRGAFRLSGLAAGPYKLTIQRDGFDRLRIKLDLLPSEQKSLPPMRLNAGSSGCFPWGPDPERTRFLSTGPATGALAGNVTGEAGPAMGARVILTCARVRGCGREDPARTQTDSHGDFEFRNIPPGRYLLRVEHERSVPIPGVGFEILGGLESSYSLYLAPCPNGDCTVQPDKRNVRPTPCD